ncbi:2-keto-4-pentenoate hydratase [Pseudonocardia sp.]|uniref:2-keto-4-pentenoate hydratase n=1 Tax=Pseudonocardia sp. TaxID=60912 RepID=UPI003D0DB3BD
MDERAVQAAERLWTAWQSGQRLAALPAGLRPASIEDGFAVQEALAAIVGPSYGWKIAATSTAGQAHIGVDGPLAGRLFDRFRHEEGERLPVADNLLRVAEAEFAFVLAADLDDGREPLAEAEVLAAVAAMHLAVETPDTRLVGYESAGIAQLVADDAAAGRFVLGQPVPGWAEVDLAASPTALLVNGVLARTGCGGNVLGDPRTALTWVANELRRLGTGLRAGDVVTTGTTTTPAEIGPDDQVVADFGELGRVRVRF